MGWAARPKNSASCLANEPGAKEERRARRSSLLKSCRCRGHCLASPCPSHLESPSIGGASRLPCCFDGMGWLTGLDLGWDRPFWRAKGEQGPALAVAVPASYRGKRHKCLALATSRHCRRSCVRYGGTCRSVVASSPFYLR